MAEKKWKNKKMKSNLTTGRHITLWMLWCT